MVLFSTVELFDCRHLVRNAQMTTFTRTLPNISFGLCAAEVTQLVLRSERLGVGRLIRWYEYWLNYWILLELWSYFDVQNVSCELSRFGLLLRPIGCLLCLKTDSGCDHQYVTCHYLRRVSSASLHTISSAMLMDVGE